MVVKAVLDRVFIRIEEKKAATEGGIFLPETYQDTPTQGVVESKGERVSESINIGDKVLFHVFDELLSNDPSIVVVRESSILGVFDND